MSQCGKIGLSPNLRLSIPAEPSWSWRRSRSRRDRRRCAPSPWSRTDTRRRASCRRRRAPPGCPCRRRSCCPGSGPRGSGLPGRWSRRGCPSRSPRRCRSSRRSPSPPETSSRAGRRSCPGQPASDGIKRGNTIHRWRCSAGDACGSGAELLAQYVHLWRLLVPTSSRRWCRNFWRRRKVQDTCPPSLPWRHLLELWSLRTERTDSLLLVVIEWNTSFGRNRNFVTDYSIRLNHFNNIFGMQCVDIRI